MRRATASVALALSAWVCGLVAGCAAPGDPTTRHPVVPTPITNLAARQAGSDVVLTFAIPTRSTDREDLAEEPAIEIYRATLPPGAAPDQKTPWRLVYTVPSARVNSYAKGGQIEFRDPLAAEDLARLAGSTLTYNVRTREVKARASADSNIITLDIHSPPEPPQGISTAVTEIAIVLSWRESATPPGASSVVYRVYRSEIESGQEDSARDLSQLKMKSPLELAGSTSSLEFQDTNIEFGRTYVYWVRSAAEFSTGSVESADSSPAVVTPRDVFPPAAPANLEITNVLATPQSSAYVELSWAISSEADLAGYNVYRSDAEDTSGDRMNGELMLSPTFRDISVVSGKRYFYRVTAVDRTGNESSKSSAVQIVVP